MNPICMRIHVIYTLLMRHPHPLYSINVFFIILFIFVFFYTILDQLIYVYNHLLDLLLLLLTYKYNSCIFWGKLSNNNNFNNVTIFFLSIKISKPNAHSNIELSQISM